MSTFIPIPPNSDFTLSNIPFGIFSTETYRTPRAGTRIGDTVIDLKILSALFDLIKPPPVIPGAGLTFSEIEEAFTQTSLNDFAALGTPSRLEVRNAVLALIAEDGPRRAEVEKSFVPVSEVVMHLPMTIGDYTDFCAGKHHAHNCGVLFGHASPLPPSYFHLPIAYHGRASTVVVSGTPIRRPSGQLPPAPGTKIPRFGKCEKLDIELEMACFVSTPSEMGTPIKVEEAGENVFGYVLMNDWSARDVQAWEMMPLGPFNSKNFGTSISPWVVTPEALASFRVPAMSNDDTELLPYLGKNGEVFDIQLEVQLKTGEMKEAKTILTSNAKNLVFGYEQLIAHHTITGCSLRTGDLLASGTISGPDGGSVGSFLEAARNGTKPISLGEGVERSFLEDGDEVVFRGWAGGEGNGRVGFGECRGVILPSR